MNCCLVKKYVSWVTLMRAITESTQLQLPNLNCRHKQLETQCRWMKDSSTIYREAVGIVSVIGLWLENCPIPTLAECITMQRSILHWFHSDAVWSPLIFAFDVRVNFKRFDSHLITVGYDGLFREANKWVGKRKSEYLHTWWQIRGLI